MKLSRAGQYEKRIMRGVEKETGQRFFLVRPAP
jgi:hypothetical protein